MIEKLSILFPTEALPVQGVGEIVGTILADFIYNLITDKNHKYKPNFRFVPHGQYTYSYLWFHKYFKYFLA